MNWNEAEILRWVYWEDPKGKRSGTGYIRSRCKDGEGVSIEVRLDKSTKKRGAGFTEAESGRSVDATLEQLSDRGRVVGFSDDDGKRPMYRHK